MAAIALSPRTQSSARKNILAKKTKQALAARNSSYLNAKKCPEELLILILKNSQKTMPMSLLILKEQQRNGKEAICQILLNRFKILEAVSLRREL
ncbi:hypothetical protein NC651_012216 [Populus alba x Populus x berolinensis]|nr:hypothetical protein NC651_012216 [Populus alba x Populus x berolinensis]